MQIGRGQQHFPTCLQRQRQTHIHTIHRDTHKQSPKQKHSPHTQKQTFTDTDTRTQTHTQTSPDSYTHTPRDRCVWTQKGTYSIPTTHSGNTRTDPNTHAQKHTAIETDIHRETYTHFTTPQRHTDTHSDTHREAGRRLRSTKTPSPAPTS